MTVFWILTSTSFGSKKKLAEFILKCNIYLFISLSFSITQMRNSVHFLLVLSFLESKKRVKFRFSWSVHVLMCTIVYQEIFSFLILPPSKSGACAKVVPFFWNNTKIIDTRFTFNKIVELNRLKAELIAKVGIPLVVLAIELWFHYYSIIFFTFKIFCRLDIIFWFTHL